MLACWAFMPLAAVYIARIMFVLDLSITGGPETVSPYRVAAGRSPAHRVAAGLCPAGEHH
jgi:hypothetical protein